MSKHTKETAQDWIKTMPKTPLSDLNINQHVFVSYPPDTDLRRAANTMNQRILRAMRTHQGRVFTQRKVVDPEQGLYGIAIWRVS